MDKSDVLQRIPMFDYPNCDYKTSKDIHLNSMKQFLNEGCTVLQSVNGHYYYGFEESMDENGMDKFVAMLAGMLFMIEHDDVENDHAYGMNWDINDFETGKYDDLFTAEDLSLIKKDIQTIKEYLLKHPEKLVN